MMYAVELTYNAMVIADSPEEAVQKARHAARDIVNDSPDCDPRVLAEISAADQLSRYGWDDRCIPYGHDGNTRIKEILKD